ncbi:neprilysin-1-like [Dermacentor variabilis]|uniref:neprilysin-1-like n=1 Tax=Dermacentor variabilis TaxID=34621 RepID=UPI003F5B6F72
MAHEMALDLMYKGLHYDARGMKTKWWTNYTEAAFFEKADCFLKQYGSIVDPLANMTLNATRTYVQDIVDNAAIQTAFHAYLASSEGKPSVSLPGLENFSPEQLFFLSYASAGLDFKISSRKSPKDGTTLTPPTKGQWCGHYDPLRQPYMKHGTPFVRMIH